MKTKRAKTNIISGFLGVGKTTALRAIAQQKPRNEKWAILVNEFGLVGIDGATLRSNPDNSDIEYSELPGGCICCTSHKPFRDSVLQILNEVKPERLIIEPTGLAEAQRLSYDLSQDPFSDLIEMQAVITLVDPRRFILDGVRKHPIYEDQIAAADVLVANRCDLAQEDEVKAFIESAKAIQPPKSMVATTRMGALDPLWLSLPNQNVMSAAHPVAPAITERHHDAHAHAHAPAPREGEDQMSRWVNDNGLIATCGWIFPYRETFTRKDLEAVFNLLIDPGPMLPKGAMRIKGIFRLGSGFELANADSDGIHWEAIGDQKDSRVEIITDAKPEPNWRALEVSFMSATRPIPR